MNNKDALQKLKELREYVGSLHDVGADDVTWQSSEYTQLLEDSTEAIVTIEAAVEHLNKNK